MLAQLDTLSEQILQFEGRLKELVEVTPPMQWLMTLPGVGVILAATVALEIGEIERFPSAEHLASYGGTTPRVHASGDRVRYGRTRPDVNRYLKWAFAEAANSDRKSTRLNSSHSQISYAVFCLKKKKKKKQKITSVHTHMQELKGVRVYVTSV